ncbi:MAG: peptidoglycan DD-metalloendopeptidase family protein [Pseudomonadales bacterium]|nr:peptidoglycan DD-metalloendopeptidase family protein [Pseudomonadales bacterium]MBO7006306.1 peptidoglycan DD-metalloendopeptidase family protein [Pseudomonadales bacterium]
MQNLVTLLILFSLPIVSMAQDDIDQAQIEAKLKALETEIDKFKKQLESTEGEKSDIEATLEKNEKGISDLINKIEDIEKEIDTNQDRVSHMETRQSELLGAKAEQQDYIERQIRAAYEIGNQEYLKVLLNQEDPNEMARMLTYYDYFNKARAAQINNYNEVLVELDQVTLALTEEMTLLHENRLALDIQRQHLSAAQREKQSTLRALIAQIKSTGSEITKLTEDRGRLEQLLDKLQNRLANIPTPGDATPFSNMRGKLILPVAGNISHTFGHRRNQGKLSWQGVFIDAPEGDPVYAVHYGRVVFSDWLRGFGLLMIISHGEGYMSLYGHNQALYRATGEWVTAGDVIATVGDSGGQNRTGLYFEIRIDGKPNNPQQWCIAREQRAA